MDNKKIILVLGASSGIATELNKFLYKKFKMYFFYFKNKPKNLKNTQSFKLNLNNYKKLDITLSKLRIKNSKIIILNLASVKYDKISFNINNADLEKTFSINCFSFLNFIKHFLPTMINQKWGRVINFSSTAGSVGEKGTLLYTSSKNAAFGMMNPEAKLMLIFLPIPIKAKYFIPGIIVLDVISALTGQSFFSPSNTAYMAHVGGALTGFLIMWYWKKTQFNKNRWD